MAEHKDVQDAENRDDSADRGLPSINRGAAGGGLAQKLLVGVGAVVTVVALIAVNGGFASDAAEETQTAAEGGSNEISNHLGPAPEIPDPPEPPPKPEPKAKEPKVIHTGQLTQPKPAAPPRPRYLAATHATRRKDKKPTPRERKRDASLLAFADNDHTGGTDRQAAQRQAHAVAVAQHRGDAGGMVATGGGAERADGLGANLKPTQVSGARASVIANRNMFITKGTFLDCALETAISSDVPGMTSCRLTRDVYSTSGRVVLLERGSKVVGQYQSGMEQGKARIFVLWTRVETPNGVVVNLDSPGTDALGRSGHSGYLDTHFWQRFGSAIMLSLIDDVGTYAAHAASSGKGNTQVQFGGTAEAAQNAAGIALEHSIDIPPTLVKHQGDHISIFVARDLDFRGVYDLKPD